MRSTKLCVAFLPVAYANLGSLYLEQRFNESADETEKALDLNADDYAVWDNLNQAYKALGDDNKAFAARKRATDLAEKVLALNPWDAEAHAVLGSLQAQNLGDHPKTGHTLSLQNRPTGLAEDVIVLPCDYVRLQGAG